MAKQKTTIIFLDNNQKIRRPLLVPTFFLKYWKTIGFCLFALVGIGMYTLFLLGKQHLYPPQKQIILATKKNKIDTIELAKQYHFITKQIEEVNKLLINKGIKVASTKNAGGETSLNPIFDEENRNLFEKYLDNFKYTLSHLPIGYPVNGKITSKFGYRENPFTGDRVESHKGLDIKGNYGTLVKSTADGKVIFAGNKGGYGKVVVIKHGLNYTTYYGHLSKILVKNGQHIKANAMIGKVGSTGRSTGPHLHYEIHKNGKIINPKTFLSLN